MLVKSAKLRDYYGNPLRLWCGTHFLAYITEPEEFEILLNSPDALAKQGFYDFFVPLLGQGLFTSRDRELIARKHDSIT